jgi:deoxyribodipyrimidine photo-lyase
LILNDKVNIFWFRRDLRLYDNCGLYHALKDDLPILPCFIFDTDILSVFDEPSDKRIHLINAAVIDLKKELKSLGSDLLVLHGKVSESFEMLLKNYAVEKVYCNHDYEPYALERDRNISDYLKKQGKTLISYKDQVLFEKAEICKKDGSTYKIFTPYARKWKEKLAMEAPVQYNTEALYQNFYPFTQAQIPKPEDMAYNRMEVKIPPIKVDTETLNQYAALRDYPAADATTGVGFHLRMGLKSIRELVILGLMHSEVWLNELIWREFFMQLLYHHPHVVSHSFKSKYDQIEWSRSEKNFEKWTKGETGFPLVDAGMRELNNTGYMHNRVRMITASFLCKYLCIDWRWGEAYFAQKLLDYELSSNNGNWQWAAGTGADAAPWFRFFNPLRQQERYDPEYRYIKKWIEEWGSKDYPEPMIDIKTAKERTLKLYKKALE